MANGKLITVSYRLPYRVSISHGKLVTSPSVGGLATALTSYFDGNAEQAKKFDSLHWIGISDVSKKVFDKVSSSDCIERGEIKMHPVFLTSQSKENFYDGFCNSVLWPLFLYFPSYVIYKKIFFDEYTKTNQQMLGKIMEIYSPGDTIWIHDYHWMLLPSLLREELPEAKIGFFLHIPFPSHELYRLLPKPWRVHLLWGLLGANVIGFQTPDFVKCFKEAINYLLPRISGRQKTLEDERPNINSFPISIDYEKFSITSEMRQVRKSAAKIREKLNIDKVILSVDRLDYTKAIFSRIQSFELFLEQNSDFKEKVSYILLMVPTRESILKYKENKLNVEALISRVNGKYGTLGWAPIVYQYRTMDFKQLVALYGAADIAMVVPYRDGMNLVAKEYVASRPNSDGVLILSETAGAASELDDAILVNANDTGEVADAILEALTMPLEVQQVRIRRMQGKVRKNNIRAWASDFLTSIDKQHEIEQAV